jgi:hypothetical protein
MRVRVRVRVLVVSCRGCACRTRLSEQVGLLRADAADIALGSVLVVPVHPPRDPRMAPRMAFPGTPPLARHVQLHDQRRAHTHDTTRRDTLTRALAYRVAMLDSNTALTR